jgi:hypothetical protein
MYDGCLICPWKREENTVSRMNKFERPNPKSSTLDFPLRHSSSFAASLAILGFPLPNEWKPN